MDMEESKPKMELPKRQFVVRNKRFYVDGMEDQKRKVPFIKICESYSDGKRSRVHIPGNLAHGLKNTLPKFEKFCENIEEKKKEYPPDEAGVLFSKSLINGTGKNSLRFYMDLVETRRGFPILRITQVNPGNKRFSIGIAGDSIKLLREALADVLKELDIKDPTEGDVPEPRHLRIGSRLFHFDITKTYRGLNMRISETSKSFRDSIMIPVEFWGKFRDIIDDYLELAEPDSESDGGDGTGGQTEEDKPGPVVGAVADDVGEDMDKCPVSARGGGEGDAATAATTSV